MNEEIEIALVNPMNNHIIETRDEDRLITYLKDLAKPPKNNAALASLRRGLGKKPKTVMEMFPYLGQFLSRDPNYETAVFIIAALFAYYDDAPSNIGNLGASLQKIKDESGTIEKRFVALLNADEEELPHHLRQIIGILKSKSIALNWEQLFFDVRNWKNEKLKDSVQYFWAKEYWKDNYKEKNQDTQNTQGENL